VSLGLNDNIVVVVAVAELRFVLGPKVGDVRVVRVDLLESLVDHRLGAGCGNQWYGKGDKCELHLPRACRTDGHLGNRRRRYGGLARLQSGHSHDALLDLKEV
jgi:hypothetical protein